MRPDGSMPAPPFELVDNEYSMLDRTDLVFIDPPYGKALIPPILKELSEKDILNPSAIVVSKSSNRDKVHASYGDLTMVNSKYYGRTNISIYHYGVNK